MVKSVFETQKKSTTNAIKTASERTIQKTAEATSDLIGDKVIAKITSVSKKPQNNEVNDKLEAPKERYISPEKRRKIIDELRLV